VLNSREFEGDLEILAVLGSSTGDLCEDTLEPPDRIILLELHVFEG
jgi:hypothetical protein